MFGGAIHLVITCAVMALVLWQYPDYAWHTAAAACIGWPVREALQRWRKGKAWWRGWSYNNWLEGLPPGFSAALMAYVGLEWWLLPGGLSVILCVAWLDLLFSKDFDSFAGGAALAVLGVLDIIAILLVWIAFLAVR